MTKAMTTEAEQVDITLEEIRKLRHVNTRMLAAFLVVLLLLVPTAMFLLGQHTAQVMFLLERQEELINELGRKVDNNSRSTTVIIGNLKAARDRHEIRLNALDGKENEE